MSGSDLTVVAGESILKDTIAEMTCAEFEAAVARGAVALWGLGVVEQHGPHLPAGTDIYIPAVRMRLTRQALAARGIEALIVPVYYWGVNHVSSAFPASFQVSPKTMVALMCDVIASLARDGVRHLFCTSGHGDASHNRAILDAVTRASEDNDITALFAAPRAMLDRLGTAPGDPNALAAEAGFPAPTPETGIDLHAGDWETSLMLAIHPEVVRTKAITGLEPTRLGFDDLAEWRKGGEAARTVTPDGYFGDPAAATRERGLTDIRTEAGNLANAIASYLACTQAGPQDRPNAGQSDLHKKPDGPKG